MTTSEIVLTTLSGLAVAYAFWYRHRYWAVVKNWEREQLNQMDREVAQIRECADRLKKKSDRIQVLEHRLQQVQEGSQEFVHHVIGVSWSEAKGDSRLLPSDKRSKEILQKAVATYTSSTKNKKS